MHALVTFFPSLSHVEGTCSVRLVHVLPFISNLFLPQFHYFKKHIHQVSEDRMGNILVVTQEIIGSLNPSMAQKLEETNLD